MKKWLKSNLKKIFGGGYYKHKEIVIDLETAEKLVVDCKTYGEVVIRI